MIYILYIIFLLFIRFIYKYELYIYNFVAFHEQLRLLATEGKQNPKLQELKFILDEEYNNNDQTRTVLFVRTRALADVSPAACLSV